MTKEKGKGIVNQSSEQARHILQLHQVKIEDERVSCALQRVMQYF